MGGSEFMLILTKQVPRAVALPPVNPELEEESLAVRPQPGRTPTHNPDTISRPTLL